MNFNLAPFHLFRITLLCCFICTSSFSQKKQIDSLKVIIAKAKHDTIRIANLNAWGDILMNTNLDSALIIYKQVKKIIENNLTHLSSTSSKHFTHVIRRYNGISHDNIGYVLYFKHENDLAMKQFFEAAKIRELVLHECAAEDLYDSKILLARTYQMIGEFNRNLSNNKDAILYGEKCLALRNEIQNLKLTQAQMNSNKSGMASIYLNLASAYSDADQSKFAMNFLSKALKLNIEMKNLDGVASCYGNMAIIGKKIGDAKKELEYWTRALEIRKQQDNKNGISRCLRSIAGYYESKGNTEEAKKLYLEALSVAKSIDDIKNTSATLTSLSGLYQNIGEDKKALECIKEALKLKIILGDQQGIAYAHGNLARYYQNQGNFRESLKEYQFTLEILEKIDDLSGVAIALNNIGNIYMDQGLLDESFLNYNKCLAIYKKMNNKWELEIVTVD